MYLNVRRQREVIVHDEALQGTRVRSSCRSRSTRGPGSPNRGRDRPKSGISCRLSEEQNEHLSYHSRDPPKKEYNEIGG